MELTDETVAKALGWEQDRAGWSKTIDEPGWREPETSHYHKTLPPFTTSLDAITQEIERRKLKIGMFKAVDCWYAWVGEEEILARAKRAPLALCKAFMAYLEQKVPA